MSTKHREQFADVGNGGELRFGELQKKLAGNSRTPNGQRGAISSRLVSKVL